MEYACALFHCSLPQYLSVDLERCQKRALRIIFPNKEYDEALACTGFISLHERREKIATKLFFNVLVPGHKLHKLLPPRNVSRVDLGKSALSIYLWSVRTGAVIVKSFIIRARFVKFDFYCMMSNF